MLSKIQYKYHSLNQNRQGDSNSVTGKKQLKLCCTTLSLQLRVEYFRDRCIKVYAGGEEVYVLHNSKNDSNPTKPFNDKQIDNNNLQKLWTSGVHTRQK